MSRFSLTTYREAHIAPVFFGSAINNFGIQELLETFIEIAPVPQHRITEERDVRPDETPFSGFVFKIHANIDPRHCDRIAFLQVVSGTFIAIRCINTSGWIRIGRFNNPYTFMAASKDVIEEAYPGDVIGYDTGNFKIGDSSLKAKHFIQGYPKLLSGTVHGIDQCRSYEV